MNIPTNQIDLFAFLCSFNNHICKQIIPLGKCPWLCLILQKKRMQYSQFHSEPLSQKIQSGGVQKVGYNFFFFCLWVFLSGWSICTHMTSLHLQITNGSSLPQWPLFLVITSFHTCFLFFYFFTTTVSCYGLLRHSCFLVTVSTGACSCLDNILI